MCRALGPGSTDFESTQIIGTNQFQMALQLYQTATTEITGPITWVHTWVNMENTTVDAQWTHSGQVETTCLAALGDGFAGGTTDGPGAFDFRQGSNSTKDNPFWNFLANFIFEPSQQEKLCQAPKPILLNTGGIHEPGPWTAGILPLQMIRIGQFFLTAVPGEFTTMSGRRLRDTISQSIRDHNVPNPNSTYVVIAGLANSYSHYIATWEEFQQQRYEGASTLYGPNTLAAYQMYYYNLTGYLINNELPPHGPNPPNLTKTWTLFPPWLFDEAPAGKSFGDVEQDANSTYPVGGIVTVKLWGANPRNNLRTNSSFLNVERMNSQGQWEVYACDGDWETKYYWQKSGFQSSLITLEWDVPSWTPAGTYRLHYYGDAKSVTQEIKPIEGVSSSFQITA
jgi:neutral ceramidase